MQSDSQFHNSGLSQEGLKLIACITMLIDHIGTILIPLRALRAIGRVAFPIYCFMLVEGSERTHNPKKYALRLAIGALLSEAAYDFGMYQAWTWKHQSVMLTLLIGFCALEAMMRVDNPLWKLLISVPFAYLAQLMHTDYGARGVMMIAMFALVRGTEHENWLQFFGLLLVSTVAKGSYVTILGITIKTAYFASLAAIPIAFYSGRKMTHGKAVQWAFYLFYPVHLVILRLIKLLIL